MKSSEWGSKLTDWVNLLLSLVVSGGTSGALVIWLAREWISTRLKASIQHEYDQNLEAYKTQLKTEQELAILDIKATVARDVSLHTTAHAAFSEGQKASMERKLTGIETLWGEVLRIRNGLPSVLSVVDVMTLDEYRTAKDHPRFREHLSVSSPFETITDQLEAGESIEKVRPYVGEDLWIVFWCYRGMLMRILFLLHSRRETEWHKDSGIRQLMAAVLTDSEITEFDRTDFGKIGWLKLHFETKFLASAQQVIFW